MIVAKMSRRLGFGVARNSSTARVNADAAWDGVSEEKSASASRVLERPSAPAGPAMVERMLA
jgi:hypothetical protein